jgi:hypothetical protein
MRLSKTANAVLLAALLPATVAAQTQTLRTDRVQATTNATIGGTTAPSATSLRLLGLATSGGTEVLIVNTSTGDVSRRILARSDLPSAVAYEDEANTFTAVNAFQNDTILRSVSPILYWQDTDSSTDQTYWRAYADGDTWRLEGMNDARSVVMTRPFSVGHRGSLVLNPFSKQVLPSASYEGTIGSPLQKWLALYAAELNVETLVAQDTIATTGGRVLVGPTTTLIEDLTSAATTIKVKHNNLSSGDRVYMEANGRVEFMAITSGATRINLAGAGNLSAESGTTHWNTNGTNTLASSAEQRWHGAKSLKWTFGSGTADVYFSGATLANSTTYTVSLYIKRFDGAAVAPVAGGDYRLYVDAFNGTICNPTVQDVGDGWYRLACSGTTGAASACCVGVAQLPTSTAHYIDAVQVEQGLLSSPTPWSMDSSSYTVTRDLDGTGADNWDAGGAVFNTGQTGNGFIDLYALRGVRASTEVGPTIVGNVRLSTTYNDWAPRWAVGNLNGVYGYGSTTFGAAFGDPSDENLTIDSTNGIRFRSGTTNLLTLTSTALDLVNSGVIKSGSATALDTGAGVWLAANSGTPQFRIGNPSGNRIRWDGSNVTIAANNFTVDGSSVRVAANSAADFDAGNGYNFVGVSITGGDFGVAGYDAGAFRTIAIDNVFNSTSNNALIRLSVGNGGAGGGTVSLVENTASSAVLQINVDELQVGLSTGSNSTLTCGAGQAVKNITVSRGIVTSVSCGAP